MGLALQGGYRSKAFVMTKVDGRKEAARRSDPLRRCESHICGGWRDGGIARGAQGRQDTIIGFTGHKDPQVHLYMLETARRHRFRFDAVQMPLNLCDTHYRSFEKQVLPELVAAGIGVLGMKSMGSGVILETKEVTPIERLHYSLNLPTSVVITGIDSMKILKQAFKAAATFRPLTKHHVAKLRAKSARVSADGQYELFKTTSIFDSTARHPEWLGRESSRTQRLAGN